MLDHPLPDVDGWVAHFNGRELPVLRQTVRRLDQARERIDDISGRDIAHIVLQDPLLAVRVLAYIQPFRGRHLRSDITTIGSAVMMLGIEPFFRRFEGALTIENILHDEPHALLGVLQVIRRAQRASTYAYEWAIARHDLNMEEVALAALLHDLSEVLLWCFAPRLALQMHKLQQDFPTMRSAVAQDQVLGIRLADVQLALCNAWHLPELLKTLMDDAHADNVRVQNVMLAVNLARHSSHGWNDPALPDDYSAIERLLHVSHETLMAKLKIPPEWATPRPAAPEATLAPAVAAPLSTSEIETFTAPAAATPADEPPPARGE